MKILITGADGLMGQEFRSTKTEFQTFFASHSDCDITNIDSIKTYIRNNKLEKDLVIINCAANRDAEQMELSGIDSARAISIDGPHNLATVANEIGATLIHFSSDYVFDGEKTPVYRNRQNKSIIRIRKIKGHV